MQYRHNQAWFTFHYVSIKSDTVQPVGSLSVLFTFHYVSIKSSMWPSAWAAAWAYLHSTMYLLNPTMKNISWMKNAFTFHYVSIKSSVPYSVVVPASNLHSTMYLLNPTAPAKPTANLPFTFHYVSIKSGKTSYFHVKYSNEFTFHYVSIKSLDWSSSLWSEANLHSTMYLLNHQLDYYYSLKHTFIYIPLCIY